MKGDPAGARGPITEAPGALLVDVKVVPRASRDRLGPRHGDRIKVQLCAPPVDGAANEALRALCAKALGVPRGAVTIVRGETSREKTLRIEGGSRATLEELLGPPAPRSGGTLSRRRLVLPAPLPRRQGASVTTRLRPRLHAALLAALAVGCGGNKGTLTVTLVTPAGADPFAGAAKVHIQVGNPPVVEQTVAVSGGHFSADLQLKPPSDGSLVTFVQVEALDANGAVLARGRTPEFCAGAQDATVSVWVGRTNAVSLSTASLMAARPRMAAATVPGLGALFAGGLGSGDAGVGPTTSSELFEAYSLQEVSGPALPQARAGAVAFPLAGTASCNVGGVLLAAGAAAPDLLLFSLGGTDTSFGSVASEASLGRFDPALTTLGDGSTVITGGTDGQGAALDTAAVVTVDSAFHAAPVPGRLVQPRGAGHTVTHATTPGGDGAIVIGGGAAPEYYVASSGSFKQPAGYAAAVTTTSGHTATALPSGTVLVLGGIDPTSKVATQQSWVVGAGDGSANAPGAPLLSTARAFHTATLVGTSTLLVCGGTDSTGKALPSCDVLDVTSAPRLVTTIPLGGARTGHVALALPQGTILLAGGTDGNIPLSSIELYTPQ